MAKRRSPAVVRGVCPRAIDPERFVNPGCKQVALPLAAMPVAQLLPLHWVGVLASAVAVAALPEVLLVIEAGKSAARRLRKAGLPAEPLGAAKKVLAV